MGLKNVQKLILDIKQDWALAQGDFDILKRNLNYVRN